ncbi:MAG: protein kinase family protein [Actinomycetota bacterium]|nr:protein kinase family protein [Actinomycetota bacterium]
MAGPAPSQAPAAVQPIAEPDRVLIGRHQLLFPVAVSSDTTLWRAVDQTLARPVAVKVLDIAGDPVAAEAFLAAAVRAGRLSHPNVASVYDASADGELAIVVSEWVDGVPLSDLLKDGPLPAHRVEQVAHQVAHALAAAHRAGIRHGRLHPGNVLITASGLVKLTDVEVAAAVHPAALDPAAANPAARLRGPGRPVAAGAGGPGESADVRALGALMYAMLTGRWPLRAAFGLPAAPYADGRLCSPRQVRAGVPRELDAVVAGILEPHRRGLAPIETLPAVLAALSPSGFGPVAEVPTDVPATAQPRRQKPAGPLVRIVVPLALVAAIGLGGWLAGLAIGRVPGTATHFPSLTAPVAAAPAAPAAPPPATVTPVGLTDFDPEGDGRENPDKVPLAVDADPSTAWETDTYRFRPDFGGLKSGVGLVADLGRPTSLSSVQVLLTQPGATVELRAADVAGSGAEDYRVVASADNAPAALTLKPAAPTTARYWLIWIRRLPSSDRGYREGIASLEFRP